MSYVSREDTAAAFAGALLSKTSAYRRFDITGPEVMTVEDVFSMLEEITGKKVKIVHATPEEWEKQFLAKGGPEFWVPMLHSHMASQRGGFFGGVTNAVEELSGKKPMSMRDYLPQIMDRPPEWS